MESIKVEFVYEGQTIVILCSGKEIMRDIVNKFCNKIQVDKTSIYCLYKGKILEENISLKKLIKSENKDTKIIILAYPLNTDKNGEKKESKVKSPLIICPECQSVASIKLNKYKISINCKNNHNIKDIFLKDFENSQKLDESKIICNICNQKDKSNTFNKEFFLCLNCQKNLCPLCKSSHNNNHNIIKYDQKNYVCFEHGENFNSYCKNCEKNLCLACEMEHSNHNIISLGKLIPNKKDCDKRMNELNEKINKLREDIKKLIDILNSFMSNIEIYYNTINDINKSFNFKKINYESLNNIKEINNNNEILDAINEIINEKRFCDKFKEISNIYHIMTTKEEKTTINIFDNKYKEEKFIKSDFLNNKIGIEFRFCTGKIIYVLVKFGTTIDQLLKKYLEIENKINLINSNKIFFLYNACLVKFGDNTPVEKYFKIKPNPYGGNLNFEPKIIVNDVNNLLGGGFDSYFTFETTFSFYSSAGQSIEELLYLFFKIVGEGYLTFEYNGNKIKLNDLEKKVGDFFKNNKKPKIIVS